MDSHGNPTNHPLSVRGALALLCLAPRVLSREVLTPLGRLRGQDYGDFLAFKGIPYAEKPGRFEAPLPKRAWLGNETRDATRFGDACMHGGAHHDLDPRESFGQSEDCLFANVWVPKVASTELPVIVFIHGGGFIQRSGAFPAYWGDGLVTIPEAPALLVTFNYRLGIFGFYSSGDTGANFGFQDQQLLLRWVQNNIAAFGGDPKKVLLMGQSAGAMSVLCHLVAPGSRGLFQRAMANSPVGLHYRSREENAAFVQSVASAVLCTGARNLTACLRSRPAEAIRYADIVPEYVFHLETPCHECANILPWMPIIDAETLPVNPLEAIAEGIHHKVPTILSSVTNETLAFIPTILLELANNKLAYDQLLRLFFKDRAEEVARHYATAPDTCRMKDLSQLAGIVTSDALMTCYVRYLARALALHAPTFLSTFMAQPHSSEMDQDKLCVQGPPHGATCHAGDIPYQLPTSPRMTKRSGLFYANVMEADLARNYARSIIDFAAGKQASPFHPYRPSEDVGTTWNTSGPGTSLRYHDGHCDFWESIGLPQARWGGALSANSSRPDAVIV